MNYSSTIVNDYFSGVLNSDDLLKGDLLNGLDTAPGRDRTFLETPEKGTTPHSCVLNVYNNVLFELIKTTALDLKGGAGVKTVLDNFVKFAPIETKWNFYLDSDHPDYDKMTDFQYKYTPKADSFYPDVLITVQDSMLTKPNNLGTLGMVGIIESWELFIKNLTLGKSVQIDLSDLRPAGVVNSKGLVATGPVGYGKDSDNHSSFWAIYYYIANHLEKGDIFSLMQLLGCLNDTLRRGGFKRGIVCSSLRYDHPDVVEYLTCDITEIPGSHKKAIRVPKQGSLDAELLELICDATNAQGIFWEKIDEDSDRYPNVCEGIKIRDRGTCLIWRENLGQCLTVDDVVKGMEDETLRLCELHTTWRDRVDDTKSVASLKNDNQIGVDVMGMANMLRIWGITYDEFNEALVRAVIFDELDQSDRANQLVTALAEAYKSSTRLADEYMKRKGLPRLEYIHTVEPAQSHSYECKDIDGFTICRGIWPPFSKRTRRRSNTNKNIVVKHGDVEVASSFDPDFNFILCNNYYRFMKKFGRPHAISVDDWGAATPERFEWWRTQLDLPTKYYTEASTYKEQQYLRKRAVVTESEPVACGLDKSDCPVCAE